MKKLVLFSLYLLVITFLRSQDTVYFCDFDHPSDTAGWHLENGFQSNRWTIGTDSTLGSAALYVTDGSSSANSYCRVESLVYAYRRMELPRGSYRFGYDWRCAGERNYDFLRVFLVPDSVGLSGGLLPEGWSRLLAAGAPTGWLSLDGDEGLYQIGSSSWHSFVGEVSVVTEGAYKLVFVWTNDASGGDQPPAAVDNLFVTRVECSVPVLLYVDHLTPNSFDLHWTDMGMDGWDYWLVTLDTADNCGSPAADDSVGTGMQVSAYDTVVAFTGLQPNTDYTVCVRTVCAPSAGAVGDTLDSVLVVHVHTPCQWLTTLPYVQDFESVPVGRVEDGDVPCWRWLDRGNVGCTEWEGSTRCLYWYVNGALRQYAVMPGIDTTVFPIRDLQLSFRGRNRWSASESDSGDPFSLLEVGVMTNPADGSAFVPVDTVRIGSVEWERYTVELGGYRGDGGTEAGAALNVAIRILNDGTFYIDDVTIDRTPACQRVHHLAANHTATTGTLLEWQVVEGSRHVSDSFEVCVERVDTTGAPPCVVTAERHCRVSGLAPHALYRARVRMRCVNDSLSAWDTVRFATLPQPCRLPDSTESDTLQCGTDNSHVTGVPIRYNCGYSLCQSIYTAAELHSLGMTAGMLVGMDYTFTTNARVHTLSIYVTTTESETYYSGWDMVEVLPQHLVYGPSIHPVGTSGTVHYAFDHPFSWDGESNIAVTTMMNINDMGTVYSSSFYGSSTLADEVRTLCRYNTTPFTPANSMSGSNNVSAYRPTVTFYTMACGVEEQCLPPTLWVEAGEDDAVLTWLPGMSETSWCMLYRLSGDTTWQVADTHVTGNSYRLDSLGAMQRYEARLEYVCRGDTLYDQVEFTTRCAGIDMLPFVEDFEDFFAPATSDSEMEPCWHRATNHTDINAPYVTNVYAFDGAKSLYLYSNWSNGYTYIALPATSAEVGGLFLSFKAYATASYRLEVGVMTDPEDYYTFALMAEVSPTVLNEWEYIELPLDGYTGAGRHIALRMTGIQMQGVYVDDLRVDYLPPCPRPRGVTASCVTHTTAMLGWQGAGAVGYEVEYGLTGFVQGTGSVVRSTADSLLLTGLSPSTYYDVYVRSLCDTTYPGSSSLPSQEGTDTSDWSFPITFLTECGIIDHLPYTKHFRDEALGVGSVYPTCWTCGSNNTREYPSVMNRTIGGQQEGDPPLTILGRTFCMPSRGAWNTYAMLPPLDTAAYPIHTVQVVLKAGCDTAMSYASPRRLVVGVTSSVTDILGTFVPVDTLVLSEVPSMYEVPLAAVVNAGDRITFIPVMGDMSKIYIDSVAVEPIPGCPRPTALRATTTTTATATLAWNGGGTASGWQVEYMPQGSPLGSGTRVPAGSTSLTVTGLTPATAYDFYVRSICGPADTSGWCYDPASFVTQQIPATVPYFYDFDSVDEWNRWQTLSNTPVSWYRGIADGLSLPSMYISADSGSTRSTYTSLTVNAVAYRDIDFGTADTSYILSFDASVGGVHTYSYYDGLAVFLADPAVVPQPPSYRQNQSPWGWLDDLTLLAHIKGDTLWRNHSIVIDTLTGVHRLVFYWYSPRPKTGTFAGHPAAVDNISIQYNPCPRPFGVRVANRTASSATIVWNGSANGDYRVELFSSTGSILAIDTVHTNSIQFTHLYPLTTYMVRVARFCNGVLGERTPNCTFTTELCTQGVSDTIGDIEDYDVQLRCEVPFRGSHPYSYTQQLVLASELNGAGDISSINFYYLGGTMTTKTNCTIYMGHTTLSSFASVTDYVPPETMQAVYIGDLNCNRWWNRIYFDSPFAYNGTDNLVVAIDDNSGIPQTNAYYFAAFGSTLPMTLSYYSNDEDVDCSTSFSLNAFGGDRHLYDIRAVMAFDFCPPNNCPVPRLRTPEVRVNSVTLRWRRDLTADTSANRYRIGYRLHGDNRWIVDNRPVDDTFFVINNVFFDTDYVYHVRQYCDTDAVSNWAVGSFNTAEIPCLPPVDLHVTDITHRTARLVWTPDDNNISYHVHLWGGGFDTLFATYIAGYRLRNLNAASRYYAAVKVTCEYLDQPSIWSDTVSFVTRLCPDVTELNALEVHGNSVLLDWDEPEHANGDEPQSWLIEWGLQGFDHGTGVTVTADHHPFLLTGLTGETTYDIVVRAVCGNDYYSEGWSPRLTLTTAYSGIDQDEFSILNSQYSLSPNPTTGDVELLMPAAVGTVRVEIVDMEGRVCLSCMLPPGTERATINTSTLPVGAYYVRVTTDAMSVVKKLLKTR